MTTPRAAVTGWLWPLALEAAARRAPRLTPEAGRRPVSPSLGPGLGRVWEPGRRQTAQSGRGGKGLWEPLCATVRPLVPHASCSQVGLGKPWATGWGLPSFGIQQVLEVGEAGGWGWG